MNENRHLNIDTDVVPIRHGRWIVTAEFPDCVYAQCDQCKIQQVFYYSKPLTNYCPNCGANMRDNTQKTSVNKEVKHG